MSGSRRPLRPSHHGQAPRSWQSVRRRGPPRAPRLFRCGRAGPLACYAEQLSNLGGGRFDFDDERVFDGLEPVQHALWMAADVAWTHDELIAADRRFYLAPDHVGDRKSTRLNSSHMSI